MSTVSPDLGQLISSFLNYTLQNKILIEKSFQIAGSTGGQAQVDQTIEAGGETVTGIVNDECYDPNNDQQQFASMLPPQLQQHLQHHRQLPSDQRNNLGNNLYEPLPDDERQQQHFQHNLTRQQHLQAEVSKHNFAAEEEDDGETGSAGGHFFTNPAFNAGNGDNACGEQEHLVKPSQIKQRRRLNRKLIMSQCLKTALVNYKYR